MIIKTRLVFVVVVVVIISHKNNSDNNNKKQIDKYKDKKVNKKDGLLFGIEKLG